MKTTIIITSLATIAQLVAANGSLRTCTGNDCSTNCAISTVTPPANGSGGCVAIPNTKSVQSVARDSGFIFTVYTDSNCNSGATAVRSGCVRGNWAAYSYDRGS
ncbi:hypothetical protein JX265_000447 [Neoarthrinium moseri]|uniref:Antifreeze protein n=1 Tax=Neoarthrinium moseri TaxID=1658444 RepID=A0A9P9WYJ5_9PEZI|nr:uncharacterized protein JN550_000697 [Neoarthrinium moseri]KAI1851319.1 hypothetical protein JX266_003394 [Neoarthrinium moseri]KAI1878515.1 hypothetical protein JN550_000697 [Neoarthrinium moseri]KAI1881621.1 hypothetical protein JX265_000447 [Neoarthrinium moseri]